MVKGIIPNDMQAASKRIKSLIFVCVKHPSPSGSDCPLEELEKARHELPFDS